MEARRRRYEIQSVGIDPFLQGIGSDSSGSLSRAGLRVPGLATTSASNRYLFQLATISLTQLKRISIVGIKTSVRIGVNANAVLPAYPVSMAVRDPGWSFVDGNVTFHLRKVTNAPPIKECNSPLNTEGFNKRWSRSPALLYETATIPGVNTNYKGTPDFYTALTAYTPPLNGAPMGKDLGALGAWTDGRFSIDNPSQQSIDPIEVDGPGYVVLYASVYQPPTAHAATLAVPAAMPLPPQMYEEAFLQMFPTAQYWTVFGALTFEEAA